MAYTETQSVGWGSRLGKSVAGIGLGFILIIAGTILLWWNEGNFVATEVALREGQAVTQELGDVSTVDAGKNGQLVHATAAAETKDILADPVFGLSLNAIRLERTVEYYQWVEHAKTETKKKLGGGEEQVTTYTYAQEWAKAPVNSSNFKDPDAVRNRANTVLINLENFKAQAANVSFGAYRLPDFMIGAMSGATPLPVNLSAEAIANVQKRLALPASSAPNPSGAMPNMVHVSGNTVTLGASPGTPQIGDLRVAFTHIVPGTVSIIGKVNGNTFEQFHAKNGKTIGMVDMGAHSLEDMYAEAHTANSTMTWILRAAGALSVIIGLVLITAPLSVLASVIPLLGSIVGAGTGLVSVLLGLAWSLLVIAIAWLRFRPIIGIAIVAVAVALIALLHAKGRARATAA
ncbi:MAG: TMEM43 family protein [Proteobacteria bacterium]|nr:TMEM43 family protein [Pseudomonadota bacterium]